MQRDWIFLINTFYVHTNKSLKTALTLFEDTFAKLSAEAEHDEEINSILLGFSPAYLSFRELYALRQANVGIYKGQTMQFGQTMSEITEQVRRWEALIRTFYAEDSAEERSMFPNKRYPFFHGTYEQRISAIKSLSIALEKYPKLGEVQHLVESFYNRLEGHRLAQQQQEGQKNNIGSLLNKQHLIACQELYGVLARLMYKFRYEPERVANFIDINLIRHKNKPTLFGTLLGSVRNNEGYPIYNAMVRLLDTDYQTLTDENGNFYLEPSVGKYSLEVVATDYLLLSPIAISVKKGKNKQLLIILST